MLHCLQDISSLVDENKQEIMRLATPLRGWFVIRRQGLAVVNLCVKFKVHSYSFTRLEDSTGPQKLKRSFDTDYALFRGNMS